ncbi:MAG: hypothetical protein RLZZ458_3318 [Planctomycetota bacterium]
METGNWKLGTGNWKLGTGNWLTAFLAYSLVPFRILVFGAGDRGRESILLSVVSGEIGSEWEVGFDVADEHFFVSLFAPADGLVGVGVGGIIAAVVEDGGDIDGGAFG